MFLECPQEQLLRAASQMPFTLKVFCLHSPEMKYLTFAGFCLGMCPGGGVFEGRALSVPHRSQCRQTIPALALALVPGSLATHHTNLISISRKQQNYQRPPECISNLQKCNLLKSVTDTICIHTAYENLSFAHHSKVKC